MLRNRGHNDCVLFRTRIYTLRDFGIREMSYANYRVVVGFFYWLVYVKEAGDSRTKITALAGLMVSNGRHITIGRVGKYCVQSSPTSALRGKRPRPTALFPLHKA